VLVVTYSCDQTARVRISSVLAIAASGHGRSQTKAKTIKLEVAAVEAVLGTPQPAVVLALPSAAAKALKAGARTVAAITFTVRNGNGTGVATLKLTLVRLAPTKRAR
jgi:hypothetical protein